MLDIRTGVQDLKAGGRDHAEFRCNLRKLCLLWFGVVFTEGRTWRRGDHFIALRKWRVLHCTYRAPSAQAAVLRWLSPLAFYCRELLSGV